jgi:hypothetical protein
MNTWPIIAREGDTENRERGTRVFFPFSYLLSNTQSIEGHTHSHFYLYGSRHLFNRDEGYVRGPNEIIKTNVWAAPVSLSLNP